MSTKSKVSQQARLEVPKKRMDSCRMSNRNDLKLAARSIVFLGHKEGMENPCFPMSQRERQIPLDEKL